MSEGRESLSRQRDSESLEERLSAVLQAAHVIQARLRECELRGELSACSKLVAPSIVAYLQAMVLQQTGKEQATREVQQLVPSASATGCRRGWRKKGAPP